MFGPYEEMIVYRPGATISDKAAMLQRTREHLEAGTPVICDAAFSNYSNYWSMETAQQAAEFCCLPMIKAFVHAQKYESLKEVKQLVPMYEISRHFGEIEKTIQKCADGPPRKVRRKPNRSK